MIKVILFDCDGPIIKREKYFSQRLKEERGIDVRAQDETSFFKGEFLECEVGKKDLKQVLPYWLPIWKWQGSVDELLDYWFSGEAELDLEMKDYIATLRQSGVKCYLATNNEKYRTQYLWEQVGINFFLDGLFSSCYLGHMKPELQYWEEIYKGFPDVRKDEFLVLDDMPNAIASAKKFGFNAELYSNFENFKTTLKTFRE